MAETKYRITWKTIIFPILGLTVFFLYIFLFNVDIFQILAVVQGVNLYTYLLAAVAVLLDTLFFTLAWYVLLRFLSVKLSIAKLNLFVWVGIFVDTLIPAESVSGEISKIYLVAKEQSGTTGQATASIVVQRLLGASINIVTLLLGAILLLAEGRLFGIMLDLTLILVALTFLCLLSLLLLCVKEKWTLKIVDAIIGFVEYVSRGRWKSSNVREESVKTAKTFHNAMKRFSHAPRTVIVASILSVISWTLNLTAFYLSFLSVGYASISWSAILIICSIFSAAKSIPLGVPFEVGLPEITLTTLFILVGVQPQLSATVTVLTRILTLWLRFFIGFAAQQLLGMRAITARNGK